MNACRWLLLAFAWLAIPSAWCAQPYRVIGYVMEGDALPPISAHKLDVINYAFALVDEHHRIHLPNEHPTRSLAGLVALRQANPQLKILASVGGWGGDHFSEAALSASSRERFAASAVALVRAHALDGIDIDWEYPTLPGPGITHRPQDRENFTLLLQATRAALDTLGAQQGGRHYLLTIAAADGEAARGLEIARIAAVLDWINLMTYDFYGSLTATTGHHASLQRSRQAPPGSRTTAQAVDEFLAAGVPPNKLNVGVAFYGRGFEDVAPRQRGVNQPFGRDGGFVPWRDLSGRYLHDPDFVRGWDEDAQAPWLWNAKTRTFISYDDPQSLRAKARFVRERGLGGMMYWEHRQDDDEQLLDALRDGLSDP